MGTILAQLRGKLGTRTENQMVSYWCPKMECYVYIGKMTEENEVTNGASPEELKAPKAKAMDDIDLSQQKPAEITQAQIKSACAAEETVSDLLNFGLIQTAAAEAEGGVPGLAEGVHEIKLKFRLRAIAENTDTLI